MQEKRLTTSLASNNHNHKNALNMNNSSTDKKLKSLTRTAPGSDSASVCDKMSKESGNDSRNNSRNDSRNNSRNETPRFPDEYSNGGKSTEKVDTDDDADAERCNESDNFFVEEGEVSVSVSTSSSKKRCRLKHSSAISSQVRQTFNWNRLGLELEGLGLN